MGVGKTAARHSVQKATPSRPSRAPLRLSIFTPTHRPTHLLDLWKSLQNQPFDEWVILANNGAQVPSIPDPRVRVLQGTGEYVGELK